MTDRAEAAEDGSIGKNGTLNFMNASNWAWHVESRAWYAEVIASVISLKQEQDAEIIHNLYVYNFHNNRFSKV